MPRLVGIVGNTILLFGLLVACSVSPSPAPSTKRISVADTGQRIELRAGDKLEIALPGNPSTGFQWELGAGDTTILRQNGELTFTPSSGTVGSGGQVILRFEAVAPGQTQLRLVYHRPFEKDTPPAQTFDVMVTVR